MNDTLLVAILAGLGGMVGWGAADFFAKKTVDSIGAIKSLVWAHAFGTGLFLLLALGQLVLFGRAVEFPETSGAWLGLTGFGALQMLVYWLAYEGFGKGKLAVLNPIFASFPGIVVVISVVFLGEKLSLLSGAALLAMFVGIILINVDLKELRSRQLNVVPGLKEMVAAAVLAAIWTIGWDRFISGRDALSSALLMYVFMSLAALALSRLARVQLGGVMPGLWKFLLLIGASETLAYLAITWGYSSTSLTTVVAMVSGAFSLPTIVLAYIFLKERITALQAGAICSIIAGIVMLALR